MTTLFIKALKTMEISHICIIKVDELIL